MNAQASPVAPPLQCFSTHVSKKSCMILRQGVRMLSDRTYYSYALFLSRRDRSDLCEAGSRYKLGRICIRGENLAAHQELEV